MQIPTPTAEDQFLLQFVATGALKGRIHDLSGILNERNDLVEDP